MVIQDLRLAESRNAQWPGTRTPGPWDRYADLIPERTFWQRNSDTIVFGSIAAIAPPAVILCLGYTVAWVAVGFRR